MSVIPPAIEDEGPAGPPRDARRLLGLDADACWIGYCGNLDDYQNLGVVLDAMGLLGGLDPCVAHLLIATHRAEPRLAAEIRRRELGACVRVMEIENWANARAAMEAADVLVLPRALGSGWPIKLLNYLSLGRPVVTGGCGAKVLVDGQDGWVATDDSPQAFAAALRHLLCDQRLRDALGRNGRSRFLREFTWDAVLPAVEHAYARCAMANPLPTSGAHVNVGEWTP
jgi:glycosyltransferase involved in cell wall biosynthesis